MLKIGIIGYGYWGPNLVRNFSEIPNAKVTMVSDLNPARLSLLKIKHPSVTTTTDHDELINSPDVDAVCIATPVSTHFNIAIKALKAGKHVLVEKPITSTAEDASRLIDEAAKRNLTLMVDHTFIYTGAVKKMRELVVKGVLGDIYYYDSTRVNLGLFQHDVSVIWDLAVHDLSIMEYVINKKPLAVSTTGISHVPGKPENIAFLTIYSESNIISHINVSWVAPVKVRLTLLGGNLKMIVYNDLEPSEKIKVYDNGITLKNSPESVYQTLIGYRTGDMWAPRLEVTEALKDLAIHFVDCVQKSKKPVTDGEMGLRIVKLLEAATTSIAGRGRLVELT